MRNNSDKRRQRTAPLACAAAAVAFLGLFLAALLLPLTDTGSGDTAAIVILALYALVILAMIAGILTALRQRLREIEGGEEEDASQY